jgi:hypothetical protein
LTTAARPSSAVIRFLFHAPLASYNKREIINIL